MDPVSTLDNILNLQREINRANALLLDRIITHINEGNTDRALELLNALLNELKKETA